MLLFEVNGQSLTRKDQFKPATDSVEYLKAKFTFNTDEWSNTTKTALFRNGDKSYPAVLDGSGACIIPWEALVDNDNYRFAVADNYIHVSVFGLKGATRITSNEIKVIIDRSGYTEGETPSDPTPDAYAQYVEIVKTEADKIGQVGEEVATAHSDIKNSYANSFKGDASGEVVRVDDVSPIEHNPRVWVHGKNLFDGTLVKGYYWDIKSNFVDTSSDIYRSFELFLKKGVYTLSTSANVMILREYLDGVLTRTNYTGTTHTFETKSDGVVAFSMRLQPSTAWNDSITGQIERGETATAYTPYINPEIINITRGGKNLFDCLNAEKVMGNSTVKSRSDSGMTVSGTPTTWQACCFALPESLAGKTLTLNGIWESNGNSNGGLRIQWLNDVGTTLGDIVTFTQDSGQAVTGVVSAKPEGAKYLALFVYSNVDRTDVSETDIVIYSAIQVEVGSVATDFEAYKPLITSIPNADGTVDITSVSPTMTLLTDTDGVTIDLEYNRDTTAVMGDIESTLVGIDQILDEVIGGASE